MNEPIIFHHQGFSLDIRTSKSAEEVEAILQDALKKAFPGATQVSLQYEYTNPVDEKDENN